MFALVIELLASRYVATAYNDRARVEWPPHPARLFSALLATWADGEPQTPEGAAELESLRWLEQQAAPEIFASATGKTGQRDVVTVFVPVNDVGVVSAPDRTKLDVAEAALANAPDPKARAKADKELQKLREKLAHDTAKAVAVPTKFGKQDDVAADKLLLERRTKQPRTFPSASPEYPKFGFVWPTVEAPASVLGALDRLVARLVRVGHSSTLVRATIATNPAQIEDLRAHTTRYAPDEDAGDMVIRWVRAGQTERLHKAFELHRETEARVLPASFVAYRECSSDESSSGEPPPRGVFSSDFIVLARIDGPRLPSSSTVGVSRQLRRALMSLADQPVHEVISGHKADGSPSDAPHLAVVPLPFVAGPHPDGSLLGVALILPSAIDPTARAAVMRAIGRLEEQHQGDAMMETPSLSLLLGRAGALQLQRVVWGSDRRSTLRSFTWTQAARRWASVTPVALDRNPGNLAHADPEIRRRAFATATASIHEAVRRIGLPAPIEVDVVRSAVLPGAAEPRAYPRFPVDERRAQRVLVHVRLVFAEPVRGPVLLGAGRYHGLGLCLPIAALAKEDS
jgi:CRISPR-associated protein Csb2